MVCIFLSYRRNDSAYVAGVIKDKLVALLGSESIFFDVDSIPMGRDFRQYLTEEVAKCDALVVLMGDRWLAVQHNGQRRIDDPQDFVRIEIESALQRSIPVIPVLLDHMEMPSEHDLPASIKELAYRQAVEVRAGQDFKHHIDHLINGIQTLVEEKGGTKHILSEHRPTIIEKRTTNEYVKHSFLRYLSFNSLLVIAGLAAIIFRAEFPLLCLFGALVLVLVAAIGNFRIFGQQIVVDRFGRIVASVMALVLILASVASLLVGPDIGIVSLRPKQALIMRDEKSFGFVGQAFAQGIKKKQTISIENKHMKKIKIYDEDFYVYVGDIGLTRATPLLCFVAKEYYTTIFNEHDEFEYEDIKTKIKNEDVIQDVKVKKGVELSYNLQGKRIQFNIVKVLWNLIGSDFMDIEIVEPS